MKSSDPWVKFGLFLLLMPSVAMAQYSRTETITYHDNTSKWVLGQVAKVTCVAPTTALPAGCGTTGVVMSETTYDATYGLPVASKAFDKLQQTLTYDISSDAASGQLGTIRTVADGNNNVTTFTNWKRGIPQSTKYPGTPEAPTGATRSAAVDDNGRITAVADENGFSTSYGYDAMGRLASIVYPTDDSTGWSTTSISFTGGHAAVYGLPDGHWRQVIQTGNARTVTIFDASWRPVVKENYDAGNVYPTLSQVVTRYDSSSRVAFQSFPQRNLDPAVYNTWANPAVAPNALGAWTTYDALDRITAVKQDSELGQLTTTTEYLTGFQTRVTNPRGQQTLAVYRAYDQPTYDQPHGISEMGGDRHTEIYRDVFGKPYAVHRRNGSGSESAWRYYVYDGYQQLCKTIEPESGATVMGYDGAGNLSHSWSGLSLPDTNSCNSNEAWQSGRLVWRRYTARNQVDALRFADGRGDQNITYTPDGLPSQITTYNDPNSGTPVVNAYSYNKRRLLTGESVAQPGWYAWGIGYGYSANGALLNNTYPTGLVVNYSPNALGQATAVTSTDGWTYASGVSYYPNGGVKQFTYGNGIVHTMTPNARQLPARSIDSGGVLDHEYVYDPNANVQYIYDHRNPAEHRYLYYDGLDRLTSAGSQMFGGDHWHRFTYDALDNLKSWKLAGIKDYAEYVYDAKNQLTNIKNSAGASVVGLGYDVQGNLQNKNGQSYSFDFGNRLREVTGKEYYRYDGNGRRVLSWRPTTTGAITLGQYSRSGQLLYDQNDQRQLAIEYIYLAGSLVAMRERHYSSDTPEARYQHTDALGSPVAVTNSAGTVIDRTNYEPYGVAINKPLYDGVGYTGHVQDAATGLTYMQQRYYDPMFGRFLSVDPVTAYSNPVGAFNRYWYANNNPYKFTDPDGRQSRENMNVPSTGHPFLDWLMAPSDARASKSDMMKQQFASELSQPRSWKDVVLYVAIAMSAGTGASGKAPGRTSVAAVEGNGANSAVQGVKLEKALASEAQTARVLAGEGEAIAGAGTKTALRDSDRLAAQYGGNAGDWSKVSGGNHVAKDGTKIETHAYQNSETGQVVEPKTKLRDEGQ